MATSANESLIDEIRLQLKSIEGRLENTETKQKTAAERLDDLYRALLERLNAKDDTLARVKEQSEWTLKQNDTLLKQIGLRWNLLTSLTGMVGIAFAAVFAYQTWRVDQFLETKRALDASAAAANESNKLLAQNTKAYSDILGILAHADNLMTDSNREFLRGEYIVAATRASDATDALKSALQKAGATMADLDKRKSLYSSITCSLSPVPSAADTASTPNSDSALSPKALKTTIEEALFTAYDLHARAGFFSAPRTEVAGDGLMLLALDDQVWQGYHWIGLNAERAGFGLEAKECFRRSVVKNPIGNKDYVNLAELAFIDSDFSEAAKYSDQYLHPLNHRFKTSLDAVAQFYFSAAGFLAGNIEAGERMPPQKFLQEVRRLGPDFSLEGTFTPNDLETYLKSPQFAAKVEDDKKTQIKRLADCLVSRSCSE